MTRKAQEKYSRNTTSNTNNTKMRMASRSALDFIIPSFASFQGFRLLYSREHYIPRLSARCPFQALSNAYFTMSPSNGQPGAESSYYTYDKRRDIQMNQETLDMFKVLTEFPSAPGFERELRKLVKEAMAPYTDEFVHDRLGSLFGVLRGDENGPKIMVAGHFDEVGFMVTGITDNGMIRFQPLGGWLASAVSSQRLQIITPKGTITGIVGSTPIHLLSQEERTKAGDIKNVHRYRRGKPRGSHGIRRRSRTANRSDLSLHPSRQSEKILAKAWDNRYGVGLAIELVKELSGKKLPNTVFAGATVQEEVGLRGLGRRPTCFSRIFSSGLMQAQPRI